MPGLKRAILFPTLLSILVLLQLGPVGCGPTGDAGDASDRLADADLPTLREIQPAEMVFEVPPQPEASPLDASNPTPAPSGDSAEPTPQRDSDTDRESESASEWEPEPVDSAPATRPAPRQALLIQRLVLPQDDYRVELALNFADQTVLPPDLAERWAANGFHLAELPRDKAALLQANLPRPVRVDATNLTPTAQWQPLKLVGRISGRQAALLHDLGERPPAGSPATPVRFRGGEHRLLLKLDRARSEDMDADGQMQLHILPQHHKVKDTLLPRMPQEKITDGRLFERLKWIAPPPRDRVWLLWADPPPDSPLMQSERRSRADPDDSSSSGASDTASDAEESRTASAAPPPNLGQVMFNGQHRKGPVRLVVVIAPQSGPSDEAPESEGDTDR